MDSQSTQKSGSDGITHGVWMLVLGNFFKTLQTLPKSNVSTKKAMFQLVLQKIIGMEVRNNDSDIVGLEKKSSDELIDSILLSIYSTQGEVSCGTLEKWMKLDVIIQGRKEADEADQTVEVVEGGSVTKRTLINVARLQTRLKRVRKLQQSRQKNKKK